MKKTIFFTFLFFCALSGKAREKITGINLSGYRVTIIPSAEFKYEVEESIEYTKTINDGLLSFIVKDQTGQIPKSAITLYVNKDINQLILGSSTLVMDEKWKVDSLTVRVKEFSLGELNIEAEYLLIELNYFSNFSVRGEAKELVCNAGGDKLNIVNLKTDKISDGYNKMKKERTGNMEISGLVQIKDSEEPVAGVVLQLVNPNGDGVDFTRTDEKGEYNFYDVFGKGIENINGIEEREYIMLIQKKGYSSTGKIKITLKKGQKLYPETIYLQKLETYD